MTMSYPDDMKHCVICDGDSNARTLSSAVDGYGVQCGKCGEFNISGLLTRTLIKGGSSDSETKELLPYLSAYTRQANQRGERASLDADNWRNFALAHKRTPFSRKVQKTLDVWLRAVSQELALSLTLTLMHRW